MTPPPPHAVLEHLCNHSHYEDGPLDTQCIVWHGTLNGLAGYGRFRFQGILYYAHHLGFLFYNNREAKLHVLHRCDNPACWAGDHLFEGTHKENMQDMSAKKRHNHGAKLTTVDVVKIRQLLDKHTQQEIADMFGVSRQAITDIKSGNNWGYV